MDKLPLDMLRQPDDVTCGPTCLHAIYRYYQDYIPLEQVIAEVPQLEGGGTLAVLLGCHALARGYGATIYTYNLQMFDPTWWAPGPSPLRDRLKAQLAFKQGRTKLRVGTEAYIDFLDKGGVVRFQDLTPALIRKYLTHEVPILTGLSATYLYRTAREYGHNDEYDDVRGEPSGHFVVMAGYSPNDRMVTVADPLLGNPLSSDMHYKVGIDRIIGSVLLGILTYDANLLIVRPKHVKGSHVDTRRRP